MQRTVKLQNNAKEESKLKLKDYSLASIKFEDITREIKGTTLLKVAQQDHNQEYLNYFYSLASDEPNKDVNTLYTKLYYAIHCFQDAATLNAILAHPNSHTFLMFFDASEGTSAFFTALQLDNVVAMECFLRKNINIAIDANVDRILPPHYAAQHGKTKALDFCFNKLGKEYIAKCEKDAGATVLHTALEHAQVEAVKCIVEVSKDSLNTPDQYGYTPLHLAVLTESAELVALLLSNDVDTNLATHNNAKHSNQTALQLAVANGNNEIVLLLLTHALKHTVITPGTLPATLFSDLKNLLGIIDNPLSNTAKLSAHLKLLFELLAYVTGRNQEGDYISHPYLAAAVNTLYNRVYDDKGQLVNDKNSKLNAVWQVLVNIINGNADPVANCDDMQKAILQNGRLKTLTESLFKRADEPVKRVSPRKGQ